MTKTGGKKHIKRPAAPTIWPINRKGSKFLPKMSPGPHGYHSGMPLILLLRETLNLATSTREVRYIVRNKNIEVDGRVRTNYKFPVGHMDVVRLIPDDLYYRIQYHKSGKLKAFRIENDEEKTTKVVKVIGKKTMRGGKTQISMHDGRNILLDSKDQLVSEIKVKSSIKLSVPDQKILEVYHLKENSFAMVTEGRHRGKVGKILDITRRYGPKASEVQFEDVDTNEIFVTALDYVFVLGDKEPAVAIHR